MFVSLRRRLLKAAAVFATVAGMAAHAAPIADGFVTGTNRYAVSDLAGQNPFVPSFTGSWSAGSSAFAVSATALTSTTTGYEAGGSVSFTGAVADAAQNVSRAVSVPASSTYYLSALLKRGNSNTITPGGYALVGFGNGVQPTLNTSGSTMQGLYIGFAQNGATDSGGATLDDYGDLVIRTRQQFGSTNRNVDTILVDGQAFSTFNVNYLVVARLDLNTSGTNDTLNYWVNPTSLTSDAAMSSSASLSGTVTVNTAVSNASFSSLMFATQTLDAVGNFDEPRIATSLSDIAAASPVPEPAVGVAIVLVGCLARRRR